MSEPEPSPGSHPPSSAKLPAWEGRWDRDLKIAAVPTFALLYVTVTLLAAGHLVIATRKRWPIFKTEMALILLNPILCLVLGAFWPLGMLASMSGWLCGGDKSWCGVSCGKVRGWLKGVGDRGMRLLGRGGERERGGGADEGEGMVGQGGSVPATMELSGYAKTV